MAPIGELKYMPKGDSRIMLCRECAARSKLVKEKIVEKKVEIPREKYICSKCRYKFKFRLVGDKKLKCPYCGREDSVIVDDSPDAQALLEDSEGFE